MSTYRAEEIVRIEIHASGDDDVVGRLLRWHDVARVFPVARSSGGTREHHVASYAPEDARKVVEWLEAERVARSRR